MFWAQKHPYWRGGQGGFSTTKSPGSVNFYGPTPQPPTPGNSLLGVGGHVKRGGRIKFLPQGGLTIYTRTPSTERNKPFGQKRDEGGGHMSKDGSIWQLFVLCLLALGERCPQVLPF